MHPVSSQLRKMRSMSTLADVAALARVSKATASRAFGKPDAVSPATAQRVFDAAAKLGFVPNTAARQLARGRTGILALVVPTLNNSFFTPIIAGAQQRAHELGMQLTVVVHPVAAPEEIPSFERLSRQVDGFILAAPRGSDDLVSTAGAYKPTVLLDREIEGMSSVIADTASAFGQLTRQLAEAGHHHIAYIGGPEGSWQDPQRRRAVEAAAAEGGAEVSVFGPLHSTFEAGLGIAQEVHHCGATAVIPYATAIGLGLEHALLCDGIGTLPLVSSETPVAAALGRRNRPTIDVDGEELGAVATEQLAGLIEAPNTPPSRLRLTVPAYFPGSPSEAVSG